MSVPIVHTFPLSIILHDKDIPNKLKLDSVPICGKVKKIRWNSIIGK